MSQQVKLGILVLYSFLLMLAVDPMISTPDLGWHLRTGERMAAEQSIPRSAWFSFTIPAFPWVNHEWFQDLVLYGIWSEFGFWGIRVFWALLGFFLIFWALVPLAGLRRFSEAGVLLGLVIAGFLISGRFLRPQIVNLIGLGLAFQLLISYRNTGRTSALLKCLPLFWVWANLHAGFTIGLFLWGVVFAGDCMKLAVLRGGRSGTMLWELSSRSPEPTKKSLAGLAGFGLAAAAIAALNPYGWQLYAEVFRTVSDPFAREHVTEWLQPGFDTAAGQFFFALVILTLLLFARGDRRLDLSHLMVIISFLVLGLSSIRHTGFYLLVLLPLVGQILNTFHYRLRRELGFLCLLFTGVLVICLTGAWWIQRFPHSGGLPRAEDLYPVKALEYLQGREANQRVFHAFEWGGYLLLHDRENRTFIDGRMTQWQVDGTGFLKLYADTKDLKPGWETTLEKYGITMVLIPPREPLAEALRLTSNNWNKLYEDHVAVVFQKTASLGAR